MAKFLTHESIAAGAWNRNHCTATDSQQSWQEVLCNTDQILHLTIDRMSRDWSNLAPKMRKAYSLKDVETCQCLIGFDLGEMSYKSLASLLAYCLVEENYQRSCAMFLRCMSRFESDYPRDFVEKERDRIRRSLLGKHVINTILPD